MGKGTGIAILALLIAVGALGFGVYMFMSSSPDSDSTSVITRSYTDFRETKFLDTSGYQYHNITGLSITFEVKEGECAYFLFTAAVYMDPETDDTDMYFRLNIDGVSYDNASTAVMIGSPNLGSRFFSVALQYADYSLSTGSHNVKVQTRQACGESGGVYNCFLLVNCMISTDFSRPLIIVY